MRIDELYYFTISSFLDYVHDYTELKKLAMNSSKDMSVKETVYEGAGGLDKFLGGN